MINNLLATIDRFWLIDEGYASAILGMFAEINWRNHVESYASGESKVTKPEAHYEISEGIGVLELSGPMTKKPTSMEAMLGGGSTIMSRKILREMANDPQVKQILMVIDSPGGQVSGTGDLAEDVAKINQIKPITAYIQDTGASAAYWVASQASKVYANKTARVGSIGVFATLQDTSMAANDRGIKVHVVKSGEFKGSGVPGTEITESDLQAVQTEVNEIASQFVHSVAKGRGLSVEAVEKLATGEIFVGKKAVRNGLLDGIGSLDNIVDGLRSSDSQDKLAASGRSEEESDTMKLPFIGKSEEVEEAASGEASVVETATLETHPVLAAALEAGIETPEAFQLVLQQAKYGAQYLTDLQGEVKEEAVRALGGDQAKGLFLAIEGMSDVTALKGMQASFRDLTDKQFQLSDEKMAERKTLPTALAAHAEFVSEEDPNIEEARKATRAVVGKTPKGDK